MSSEPPPADSPEAPASASPPKDAVASGGGAAAGVLETNTLWVGNLPSHVSEGDLMALFAPHGALDCALARAGSRSYAFILFRTPAEARAAVEATRGEKVKGAAMRTEFARPVIPLLLCPTLGSAPSHPRFPLVVLLRFVFSVT